MLQSYPSKISLFDLSKEADALNYFVDGSGIRMAFRQSENPGKIFEKHKAISDACKEIALFRLCQPKYVLVNIVPAGVQIPVHTDTLEGMEKLERWHLPIKTNDKCEWWDEVNGSSNMKQGSWYGPIPYWINHSASNLGTTERVHLIVDLYRIEVKK